MSTFNEADHPRAGDGKFTDKPQSAPEVSLSVATFVPQEQVARAAAVAVSAYDSDITSVFVLVGADGSQRVQYIDLEDGTVRGDADTRAEVEQHLGATLGLLRPTTGVVEYHGDLILDVRRALEIPPSTPLQAADPATRGAHLVALAGGVGDDPETATADTLADVLAHAKASGLDIHELFARAVEYLEDE